MKNADISAGSIFNRHISLFISVRSKRAPHNIRVRDFLNDVRDGRWRGEIECIRKASTKAEADNLKKRLLPAAKLSGTFRGLTEDDLIEHSGVLCLDLDDVGYEARIVREALKKDGHVVALFTSPRGTGLKVLVSVEARNAREHRACFEAARSHFSDVLPAGVKIDSAPSNIASNCFASFDPEEWRAMTDRKSFRPASKEGETESQGCDIDMSHVIQSNEKEPSSLPSSSDDMEERLAAMPKPREGKTYSAIAPPPSVIRLSNFADATIWPGWMKRVPYVAGRRNETIVQRVPILINLAAEEVVALLLLRWFNEAPDGLFNDSREVHWKETWAAIDGCIESWPKQERIGRLERIAYERLRDARQRATFRIFRSLSLAKQNVTSRVFFMPMGQLADRLNCASEPASRQIEYLVRAEVIELVKQGAAWAPGKKSPSASYRWLLK